MLRGRSVSALRFAEVVFSEEREYPGNWLTEDGRGPSTPCPFGLTVAPRTLQQPGTCGRASEQASAAVMACGREGPSQAAVPVLRRGDSTQASGATSPAVSLAIARICLIRGVSLPA